MVFVECSRPSGTTLCQANKDLKDPKLSRSAASSSKGGHFREQSGINQYAVKKLRGRQFGAQFGPKSELRLVSKLEFAPPVG